MRVCNAGCEIGTEEDLSTAGSMLMRMLTGTLEDGHDGDDLLPPERAPPWQKLDECPTLGNFRRTLAGPTSTSV